MTKHKQGWTLIELTLDSNRKTRLAAPTRAVWLRLRAPFHILIEIVRSFPKLVALDDEA